MFTPKTYFLAVMNKIKIHGLLVLLATSNQVLADREILDYLVGSITISEESQITYIDIEDLLEDRYFEEAINLAQNIIDDNNSLEVAEPVIFGKLLGNLAIVLNYAGQYEDSLSVFTSALNFMEPALPQFSPDLINIILAKASTLITMEKLDEAEQQLRRAQHITHRDDGVYTVNQLPIVKKLFEISSRTGDYLNSDKQKYLTLQILKKTYGSESTELLPTLISLGRYYADRGSSSGQFGDGQLSHLRLSLFGQSISLYEEAIEIIENNYGVSDPRLIEPLEGIARTRYIQRVNKKSEEAAERVLRIIENNPATDTQDRVNAIIRLGDLYTLTSDSRAPELYLRAWKLIQESEEYKEQRINIFARPLRLWPRAQRMIYLDKRPTTANDSDKELFIEVEYAVKPNGRVSNIRLLTKNVPNNEVRRLRTHLYETRFRPKIIQGKIVETSKLVFRQRFLVANPANPRAD